MSVHDATIGAEYPQVVAALSAAGFDATGARFTPLTSGTDSVTFGADTRGGRELVVKVRRPGSLDRYRTAAWASARMRQAGIPAAAILWHSPGVCVEAQCPGRPIDATPTTPRDLRAATRAGQLLRRMHAVEVTGFGQLDGRGVGRHRSISDWLLSRISQPAPSFDGLDLTGLLDQTRAQFDTVAGRPARCTPRLLHGDWVGRHVFTDDRQITGVVDLESVRGGDPLVDIAGWSLREPAPMTRAMLAGYYDGPVSADHLLPLVLFRLRIADALLRIHVACGEPVLARLRAAQLQADLDALAREDLTAVPRITPDATSRARRRP